MQPSPKTDAVLLARLQEMGFDARRYDAAASLNAYTWSLLLGNRQRVAKNPTVEAVAELFGDPCTPHGWGTELAIKARNKALRRGKPSPHKALLEVRGRECLVAPDLSTIQIDTRFSDQQLKREFARWLAAVRKKAQAEAGERGASRRKSPKSMARTPDWPVEMRRWVQHRVLACIDVDLLAAAARTPPLSHPALARLLYAAGRRHRNNDGRAYVRDIVRPLAHHLTSETTLAALATSDELNRPYRARVYEGTTGGRGT